MNFLTCGVCDGQRGKRNGLMGYGVSPGPTCQGPPPKGNAIVQCTVTDSSHQPIALLWVGPSLVTITTDTGWFVPIGQPVEAATTNR